MLKSEKSRMTVSSKIISAWLICVLPLGIISAVHLKAAKGLDLSGVFLLHQDLLVLELMAALFGLISVVRIPNRVLEAISIPARDHPMKICVALAVVFAVGAFVGWFTVYRGYPLSMDEFCASFDAKILQRGDVFAPVSRTWRDYILALQPLFIMKMPGDAFWASCYLPMNAAIRAVFGILGSEALAGPFCFAVAILMVFLIGRRLWPTRPDAALVSAILLATSSQALFTAMTPYAMSAHLALNLVWLWLFLQESLLASIFAVVAAFVATGLHQAIFHPLFAAPFLLNLCNTRQWKRAIFFLIAYAGICLFWMSYIGMVYRSHGADPTSGGAVAFASQAVSLVETPSFDDFSHMAENLLRFIAWQNPLTIALAAIAIPSVIASRSAPFFQMGLGLVLYLLVMTVIMPFQGHGWGYRYFHGLIGSVCLLGGLGWIVLTKKIEIEASYLMASTLTLSCIFCVVVINPIRAGQIYATIKPYSNANAAIQNSHTDIVMVDATGIAYGRDLVRNSPFLDRRPLVLNLKSLSLQQIRDICGRFSVRTFDRSDALRLGVPSSDDPISVDAASKTLLSQLNCATQHVSARKMEPR